MWTNHFVLRHFHLLLLIVTTDIFTAKCHSSEIMVYARWNTLAKCFKIFYIFEHENSWYFQFYVTLFFPLFNALDSFSIRHSLGKKITWIHFMFQKMSKFETFCLDIWSSINLSFLKSVLLTDIVFCSKRHLSASFLWDYCRNCTYDALRESASPLITSSLLPYSRK